MFIERRFVETIGFTESAAPCSGSGSGDSKALTWVSPQGTSPVTTPPEVEIVF